MDSTINFWCDNWMKDSLLNQKVLPKTKYLINHQAKVADSINPNNH